MKSILFVLLFVCAPLLSFAQTIIPPENDSTFVSEFRDGDEWAIIARNGFVVGLSNKVYKRMIMVSFIRFVFWFKT